MNAQYQIGQIVNDGCGDREIVKLNDKSVWLRRTGSERIQRMGWTTFRFVFLKGSAV